MAGGGTKRRRKAAAAPAAASSSNNKTSKKTTATKKKDINNNKSPPSSFLLHLLQSLRKVASDEDCLIDFAASLQDGKALVLQLEASSSSSSSSDGGLDRSSSHSHASSSSTTRTAQAAAAARQQQQQNNDTAMVCTTTAGFTMTMANHVLQRLLQVLSSSSNTASRSPPDENNAAASSIRVLLALLSWSMATCLDKAKWDHLGATTRAACRSWFARILLWGTAAATRSLQQQQPAESDGSSDDDTTTTTQLQWPTLIAATLALERWNPHAASSSSVATSSTATSASSNTKNTTSSSSPQSFWLEDLLPALEAQVHAAIADCDNNDIAQKGEESSAKNSSRSSSSSSGGTNTTWLEDACATVEALLDWTREEEACWNALLVANGVKEGHTAMAAATVPAPEPAPPPAKKKRGRGKRSATTQQGDVVVPMAAPSSSSATGTASTAATSAAEAAMQQQLSLTFAKLKSKFPAHFTQMEGRLAVKRWSVVAMDWYCKAVPLLLERARQLLLDQQEVQEEDNSDDEGEQQHDYEQFTFTYTKKKERYIDVEDDDEDDAEEEEEEDEEETVVLTVSAPTLAVTLVSRWLCILVDVTSRSGPRPPTGSMDTYLRKLRTPPPPTSSKSGGKKRASSSSSTSSAWNHAKLVKTDVRDLAMALARPLLQTHYEQCLDKMPCVSSSTLSDLPVWLVNDHDSSNGTTASKSESRMIRQIYYYPHLSKSFGDLSRVAASSVMGATYSEQSDYIARLDHAVAAQVFQLRLKPPPSSSSSSSFAVAAAAKTTWRRGRVKAAQPEAAAAPPEQPHLGPQYAIMDARLTRFAVGKLVEALSGIKTEGHHQHHHHGSNNNNDKKEEGLQLDMPLPLPVWPMKPAAPSRKSKKAADIAAAASAAASLCTYAGMYATPGGGGKTSSSHHAPSSSSSHGSSSSSSSSRLSSREKVALYLRAMHRIDDDDDDGDDDKMQGVEEESPEHAPFLSFLLAIVERCYDTRRLESSPMAAASTATVAAAGSTAKTAPSSRSQPAGRKRGADKASSRKSKRRRKDKDKDKAATATTITEGNPDIPLAGYSQINSIRSGLAASVLQAMEYCLEMSALGQSVGTVFPSIRSALTTSHIFSFIDLGKVLHTVLIRSRSWDESFKKEERSLLDCFFSTDTPVSLSHEERLLWKNHMGVSLVLGRGRKDYAGGTGTDRSPISGKRLEVYKKIASISRTPDMPVGEDKVWPLWLPSMHRLLLSGNLSHENLSAPENETMADKFLVDGMLASLANALQNPAVLLPTMNLPETRLCVDERVPLSLNDARNFLAAIGRLSAADRSSRLLSLLKSLERGLKQIRSDEKLHTMLCQNYEVSSFVARAISLSIQHALLVTFGRGYQTQIMQVLGRTDFGFPPVWLASDPYRAETSFMGILSEWQSSELPASMSQIPGSFTGAAVTCLRSVLDMALTLGFESAPTDRCHLLFSAWNALGKTALWGSVPQLVQIPLSVPGDYLTLLSVLRNDLCTVHRQMQRDSGIGTESTLVRVIDQKTTLTSPRVIGENLSNMIVRGSQLVLQLIAKFVPSDDSIPVEVFAVLEALTVYISFAISSLTKSNKLNFFDDLVSKLGDKRSRGYSTESEVAASDVDSACTHDGKTFALERLGEVCDAFGGVPEHPDWLSSDCSLGYNVSFAEARELSATAMEALTRVYAVSEKQYRMSLGRAYGASGPAASSEKRSLLAQRMVLLAELPCCDDYPDDRDFEADATTFCGIGSHAAQQVLFLGADEEKQARLSARELWGPSAAQRVIGKFQDVLGNIGVLSDLGDPSMRAGGEWEVLMSYALTSASIASFERSSSKKVLKYLRYGEKWENVASSALGSLVPVAALLRFSLYRHGRKAHPLSSIEAVVHEYDSTKLDLVERAPSSSTVMSKTAKSAVSAALSAISQLPANMESAAEAVATHLLIEPSSFADLRGTVAVGHALDTLSVIVDTFASCNASAKGAAPFIIELLGKVLEAYNVDSNGKTEWKRMISFLGAIDMNGVETIAMSKIDVVGVSWEPIELGGSKRVEMARRFLSPVVSMVWEDSMELSQDSRRFYIGALASVAAHEIRVSPAKTGLLDVVYKAFAKAPKRCIESLVRKEICSGAEDGNCHSAGDLCLIFAALLLAESASGVGKLEKLIFTTLQSSIKGVHEHNVTPALNLLFLYAAGNGKLRDVGSSLLDDIAQDAGPTRLGTVNHFASFLQELSSSLKGQSTCSGKAAPTWQLPEFASKRPAACSFITTDGFHEQHWYNCQTCGLTDEKGCCSLCALVCHRGHEVSYARYSSFFCDCGENSSENRSGTCKCLSALPREKLCNAYEFGLSGQTALKDSAPASQKKDADDITLTAPVSAQIAISSFANLAQKSLQATLECGQKNGWLSSLFSSMKQEFLAWKATSSPASLSKSDSVVSYKGLREIVHRERGKGQPKDAQIKGGTTTGGFSLLSSSLRGTLSVQFPSDQRSALTRKSLTRSVVVADSRGRLVIAESNQLLFCSGLAMINARHRSGSTDLSRSALPITGSTPFDLNAVGMTISRDNERRVIAWSNDAATVLLLNERASNFVHRINLTCDTDMADGNKDAVVKCGWLPGSERHAIVGCGFSMSFFDVESTLGPAKPALSVSIGLTAALRDFAIVPWVDADDPRLGAADKWKVYVLLDSGRLHCLEVSRKDQRGELTVSRVCLDEETLVDLSAYRGMLGEGRRLGYLAQSRVLLYQSPSRGVVAFVLSEDGTIKSQFQLLSEYLKELVTTGSSNNSPSKNCGYRGPYTHWKDLGVFCKGSSEYGFKVSCIATRQDNLEPALLCIEIGRTNEIYITATPLHPECATSSTSADGFAAFTAPLIQNDVDTANLSAPRQFVEKTFLCTVMSNGCIGFYAEGIDDMNSRSSPQLGFPLLLFETLKNQSQSEALQYDGEGISSPETRLKLQRDNDNFFLAPKREGYTLTVSTKPTLNERNGEIPVGLRLMFGKTSTAAIPKSFSVQGRVYSTKRSVKDWYPVVLTAGEIALAVRNGYITCQFFGESYSHESTSSCPIIDAVEVYTIDRSILDPWLPKNLSSISSVDVAHGDLSIPKPRQGSAGSESLLSSMKSLAGLCTSLGRKTGGSAVDDKSLLKDIVQSTALGCDQKMKDSIELLMKAFEPEDESFIDDGKVAACLSFLSKCDTALTNAPGTKEVGSLAFWHNNTDLLRQCLRMASGIARQRPTSFIHALKDNGSVLGSIAAPASKHVTNCVSLFLGNDGLVPDFVELCLVEMAVAGGFGSEYSSQSHLGRFATLRCVLNSNNKIAHEHARASIESFCRKYRTPKSLGDEFDLFAVGSLIACYKCDSCAAFPIKKVRYSLSNEHHPFDLCKECFQKGSEFAAQNGFSEQVDVVINGSTIGEDPFGRMTCAEVKIMESVPVHERSAATSTGASESELPDGGEEVFHRQQLYDEFIDKLFNGLLSLILSAVREEKQAPDHLIQLAVGLASLSDGERKSDRKKRLSKDLCFCLSSVLKKIEEKRKDAKKALDQDVVCFLRALSQVVVPDLVAQRYLTMRTVAVDSPEYKESLSFVCPTHKVPLKMQKGQGPHDRRFMVCGSNKCNFFVWFDHLGQSRALESEFDQPTAQHVWKLLSSSSQADAKPLHARLCDFLDGRYPQSRSCKSINNETQSLLHEYTYMTAQADISDGVLCSRERLLPQTPSDFAGVCSKLPQKDAMDRGSFEHGGIEAAMELISLVSRPEQDSSSCWFPLLCRLILAEGRSSRRQLAKTSLLRLCGRNHDKYLQVRDHHFFGFYLKKVASLSCDLLEAAAVVKEKARQCGPQWKSEMRTDWSSARGVEFLGVQNLIPEDVPILANNEAITKVLVDLLSAAKKRGDNWRRFCHHANPALGSGQTGIAVSLLNAPPIVTIFSLSTLLSVEGQLKSMKLLDLALAPMKATGTVGQENASPAHSAQQHVVPAGATAFSSLSDILELDTDVVHAFAEQFVLHGRTVELRLVACSVIMKLCGLLDSESFRSVFKRLILLALREVGELGKNGAEILGLIGELLKKNGSRIVGFVADQAEVMQQMWMQQMLALRHDRLNEEYLLCETRSGSTSQKRRYELACCVHCHGQCHGSPPNPSSSKRSDKGDGRSTRTSRSDQGTSLSSQSSSKTPWLPEQVCGFARGRLDSARETHMSDAFCSYVTLKYRLAVSDIHVCVHDPRGRYVKTITVYVTPRPVSDPSILKAESYAPCWQQVATLSLARGVARASHTLKKPVLAANFKIEYTDFYERPGGSRAAADGSMVVHCPRCTRAVINNAGVCGNCGEIAFQCRKCRHINYDRLDAFLCVECGYCASGSFSYEITAGMASNAIAITNDQEFERAQQMLETASRLHDDIRSALKDQYAALARGAKKSPDSDGGFASPTVKRAFLGLLPLGPGEKEDDLNLTLDTMGKQGTVVRTVARPSSSSSSRSGSRNRAASLLRLSSSSASSNPTRRRTDDMVIRQIGRDLHIDDDDSELLGFLEGSGGLARAVGLDPADPLSRLLASVQGRREEQRQTTSGREGSSTRGSTARDASITQNTTSGSNNQKPSSKECVEICERLYVLLREAERESYRLGERINAWHRLESDALISVGSDASAASPQFTPSHCSSCGGIVACHLLIIWFRLFQADPDSVKVTKEMIQALLLEEPGPKGLVEWKRAAVREIALKSTTGAPLILEALRLRLTASQDVNAAEILGKILETVKEGPFAQKFLDLATEILEKNQTRWM